MLLSHSHAHATDKVLVQTKVTATLDRAIDVNANKALEARRKNMFQFWKRSGLLLVDGPADRYIKTLSLLDQAETLVPEAALAIGEAKSAVMELLEVANPEGTIKVKKGPGPRPPIVVARPPLG